MPLPSPVTALRHPVPWLAAALIVLNDLELRGVAPGWLTGKLSDVGWLVVVPVLAAAALAACGVSARRSQGGSLGLAVAAYTTLQLWPPLGAWFSSGHVADAGDLLVLPAVALAMLTWRTPRWRLPVPAALAAPAFAGVLLADQVVEPLEGSWPCAETPVWPTATPFRLVLNLEGAEEGDRFRRGLHLVDEDWEEVPLVIDTSTSTIVVCAQEGLRPETGYTWTIGPWYAGAANDAPIDHDPLAPVDFTTDSSPGEPAADAEACAGLADDHPMSDEDEEACQPLEEGA